MLLTTSINNNSNNNNDKVVFDIYDWPKVRILFITSTTYY